MFGRKKPATQPQVITRIQYVTAAANPEQDARVSAYLKNAYSEYARLTVERNAQFVIAEQNRAAGDMNRYGASTQKLGQLGGQQDAILNSIALLTGQSHMTLSYDLPKQAEQRIASGETFPMTSYLSGSYPLWAENA
jgi:hypothetical protein